MNNAELEYILPDGFKVSGVFCGVKSDPTMEDLTLIATDVDAVAAGVYTENVVRSASIFWNEEHSPTDSFRALVVNSGNANACTGEQGTTDVREMAAAVSKNIGCNMGQVLVLSTGIIGEFLPMKKIRNGIDKAAKCLNTDQQSIERASKGILTTDTFVKVSQSECKNGIRILGFAKGAGMIGPRMSTMLAMVMTDATLHPDDAKRVLKDAVDESFNCISVEGHMSTSDSVILICSGVKSESALEGEELGNFSTALTSVCKELATTNS